MKEKVNRWPIIALISASALGLLTFSVLQSSERRTKQEAALQRTAADQKATEETMQKIGADAARAAGQLELDKQAQQARSLAGQELKRLEAEDRAATAQMRSTPPR